MKTTKEIREMIGCAYIDPSRDNINHILEILEALAIRLDKVEGDAKFACDRVSCIQNGIQPD